MPAFVPGHPRLTYAGEDVDAGDERVMMEAQPVNTARPTMFPARRSSRVADAWASGRSAIGGGAMFALRTRSMSSRASASVPVVVPSIVMALSGNIATAVV